MTASDPKPSYHHGNLREALLTAVDDLIREGGVGAVSLRAAARRAGVSHAAPAHHFGDKLGMLTAFAIRGFVEFRRRMAAAVEASDDQHAAVNAIGIVYIDFAVNEPAWFDVMFRTELHDRDDPELRQAADATFAVLTSAVDELDLGDSDPDRQMLAIGAWCKVHGLATLWRDGTLQTFVDDSLWEVAAQVMAPENQLPPR